jgi:hypothetical protein
MPRRTGALRLLARRPVLALDSPSSRPNDLISPTAAQTNRLWTTTLPFPRVVEPPASARVVAIPQSAVYIIATPASRKLVAVHRTARRRADDRERPGREREDRILIPLSIGTKQNSRPGRVRLRSARRPSPALLASILSADEVFGTHKAHPPVMTMFMSSGEYGA